MENISLESNLKKMLTKQKDFILQRLIWTYSRVSVFTDFFISTMFSLYFPATLWYFNYFILKIYSETHKTH